MQENPSSPYRDDLGVSITGEKNQLGKGLQKPDILSQVNSGSGPQLKTGRQFNKQKVKGVEPVIALALGPGLYGVTGHISLLKLFQRNKTPIRIISGYGLASVVAAYYAMGVTPEIIEWKFFKTLKAVAGLRPYSKKWLEIVDKYLLKYFKGKSIQNAKLVLGLPVYDGRRGKVVIKKRGDLHQILLANLTLNNRVKGNRYQAAFQYDVFGQSDTLTKAADITIALNALGSEVTFIEGSGFLVGVFGKAAALAHRNKVKSKLYFDLPVGATPLDSTKDISDYMRKCELYGKEVTEKLDSYTAQWISENKE
ncbi:MAG: hypothetical protein HOM21_13005 [Halobacteriovoraceae bacterium]|nr:hypothetical protein [Halobacteriovoraceae bacterium]